MAPCQGSLNEFLFTLHSPNHFISTDISDCSPLPEMNEEQMAMIFHIKTNIPINHFLVF